MVFEKSFKLVCPDHLMSSDHLVFAGGSRYHTLRCSRRRNYPGRTFAGSKAIALARALNCLTIIFLAGYSTVSSHKGNDWLVVLRNVSRIILELPRRSAASIAFGVGSERQRCVENCEFLSIAPTLQIWPLYSSVNSRYKRCPKLGAQNIH